MKTSSVWSLGSAALLSTIIYQPSRLRRGFRRRQGYGVTGRRAGNLLLLFLAFQLFSVSVFGQGSLTPPGAPAATMKTLDQVEPRTPIPGGTAAFTINTPGSYYLTGNITLTGGGHGISVNANSVTIDLNGFTLAGPATGSGAGVFLFGGISNVTIRNGTIRSWGDHGINGLGNSKVRAENLRVFSNGSNGITVDVGGEVINCIAESNGGIGIVTLTNSLVKDCQAITNNGAAGIQVGPNSNIMGCIATGNKKAGILTVDGCRILDCQASGNVTDNSIAFNSSGIATGSYCVITDCVANDNTGYAGIGVNSDCIVEKCIAAHNGVGTNGYGITGSSHTVVRRCLAFGNQKSGIAFGISSFIAENKVNLNGLGGAAAGLDGNNSQFSRIEGNDARDNAGAGILAASSDVVIRNTAGGNTPNYSPSSGNNFAPVQTPATATNPMANIVN